MAIEQALAAIVDDWANIEARMTVTELVELGALLDNADIAHRPTQMRDPNTPSTDPTTEPATIVLRVLTPALGDHHPAWRELRRSSTRYSQAPRTPAAAILDTIGRRVRVALRAPDIGGLAAADHITEAARRAVLRFGYLDQPDGTRRWTDLEPRLLGITLNGTVRYPVLQFTLLGQPRPHPYAMRINDLLGGRDDALAALSWWTTVNSWLDAIPAALLHTRREPEIEYAAEQLDTDSW